MSGHTPRGRNGAHLTSGYILIQIITLISWCGQYPSNPSPVREIFPLKPRIDGWMDEWMDGIWMYGWVDEWYSVWHLDGWVGGWVDDMAFCMALGWMYEWHSVYHLDGWMDG